VEIACPLDCGYLVSAQQHPPAAVQRRREREGRFLAQAVRGLANAQYQLFLFLQTAVARYAPQAIPGLVDRHVADAARALAETAETAAKGIIYEHQAASLPARRLAAELRKAIETLGQQGHGPRESDLALALRATERAAAGAAAALGGELAYLDLLGNLFKPASTTADGEAEPTEPSSSGLIIP
jgi:hypothetical protein